MSKRKHSVLDEIDRDSADRNHSDVSLTGKPEVTADVVRMIMARSSSHMKIRNEHVNSVLQASNIKGSIRPWISSAQTELKDTYGLTIKHVGNEIFLVSHLHQDSRAVLNELWNSHIPFDDTHAETSSTTYLMPKHKREPVIVNTTEQVLGGITVLIISMIVLSENRISERDLLGNLHVYGISGKLNIDTPVLNKPFQDVLTDLSKRDYIKQIKPPGATKSDAVMEYSLGERCKREFDPMSLCSIIKEIIDDESMEERIFESVKRCFPEFVPERKEDLNGNNTSEGTRSLSPA